MLTLINLFFVPVVLIVILYRRQARKPAFSLELLFDYCIAVACNIPVTKLFVVLFRLVTGMQLSMESSYYTVLALLSAALLPYVLEFLRKSFQVRCVITENDE